MKKDKKITEDAKKDARDLLDFESEGLSEQEREGVRNEVSSTKEIIDLVDVIEKGEVAQVSEFDEIAERVKEKGAFEEQGAIEKGLDLSSEELAPTPDEEATQRLEADLDSMLEGLEMFEKGEIALEISDNDLEAALDAELSQGPVPGLEGSHDVEAPIETLERARSDTPLEFSHGSLGEVRKSPEEQREAEKFTGITEEKIEAIVTRVVENVVERVARETMASVAERVVREAIDALKESLEPSDK